MEQHLGNATLTTTLHPPRNLWKSPRRAMLRIEALVLVAIILTFLTAVFGSCRRWSNHWVVQKGFLAANVLSLSLGTYSIGLMQSSSVKSGMYPIWSVSLFTLFGCVDSVTSYNGLDYMGSLLKMIFQLCLYGGYVLLMSISTISVDVGNIAIVMLSAITFIKGFHRALALVLQSRTRNIVQLTTDFGEPFVLAHDRDYSSPRRHIIVDFPPEIDEISYDQEEISYRSNNPKWSNAVTMADIDFACHEKGELQSCYAMCVAFCLSHKMQRHFLGLSDLVAKLEIGLQNNIKIDYKWALNVIDVELAFLYEIFFTGNTFLHYYHARSASVCSLASLIGICFVGVAVAIPGTMTSHGTTFPDSGSTIVDTTTADLFITIVILVFLALLQLMQLIWCWTSNCARVAFACEYARWYKKEIRQPICWLWWMRLKWFVVSRTNWFDKHLWQDKLGQCSLFDQVISNRRSCKFFNSNCIITSRGGCLRQKCTRLLRMRGLRSIGQVARDLFGVNTKKGAAIRLHDDVKASITMFLDQIQSDRIEGYWLSSLSENGVDFREVPFHIQRAEVQSEFSFCQLYVLYVMMWHVATCYCEIAEQEREKQEATSSQVGEREKQEATPSQVEERERIESEVAEQEREKQEATPSQVEERERIESEVAEHEREKQKATSSQVEENLKKERERMRTEREKNRRVAIALSRYCVYLVVSAPELLPGPAADAKRMYVPFEKEARAAVGDGDVRRLLEVEATPLLAGETISKDFWNGVAIGKRLMGKTPPDPDSGVRLCSDPWKTLALVWVQMLLFGAPHGKAEAHMRHLSRGGEFITHLWALLYHLGIRKWEPIKESDYRRYLCGIHESESLEPEDISAEIGSLFATMLGLRTQDQDRKEEEASPGQEGIRRAEEMARMLARQVRFEHPGPGARRREPRRGGEEDIQAMDMVASLFASLASSSSTQDRESEEESSDEDIPAEEMAARIMLQLLQLQHAGVRGQEPPMGDEQE